MVNALFSKNFKANLTIYMLEILKILNIDDTDYFLIYSRWDSYYELISINITYAIENPSNVTIVY